MIFFVHHYLHRGKVHTISVKTTNTLTHQQRRHQQGQRKASHQSVCPFFFFCSSLLLFIFFFFVLYFTFFFVFLCFSGRFAFLGVLFGFRIASPILYSISYFLLFFIAFITFSMSLTEYVSFVFIACLCIYIYIYCVHCSVCTRHESCPNRSTIGRPPYIHYIHLT